MIARFLGGGCLVVLVAAIAAEPAQAGDKLYEVSAEIAKQPGNPALLVRRAQLHDQRGDFASAMADLELAATLADGAVPANLAAGEMLGRAGKHAQALPRLDVVLAAEPQNAAALRAKGRALVALGRAREAAVVQRRLLALSPAPEPDQYVELSQALAATGRAGKLAALEVLDQGMARIGPVVSLQAPAIELELGLGRWQAAVGRVDRLTGAMPRKDMWLQRRGEILLRAGRRAEARRSFQKALEALDALAPEVRQAPQTQAVAEQLRRQVRSAGPGVSPRPPI